MFYILPLPETIIYVHHGQPGVWLEVALVYPGSQGVMEYLDCIVCGASARVGVIGDNTWEPGDDFIICLELQPSLSMYSQYLRHLKSRLNLL